MHQNNELTIPEKLNLAKYFIDGNITCGRGDRVAIYYRGETYSYNRLNELVNKAGNVFREFGVEYGNRVLLALNDSPEWIASWHGAIKVGAVATCAYTYLQVSDYEHFLSYVRPKVVVADDTTLDKIRAAVINLNNPKYLKAIFVLNDAPEDLSKKEYDFKQLIDDAEGYLDEEDTHRDDIAFWNFSGGTTGKPKGVPHMHRDGMIGCESWQQVIQLTDKDIVVNVPKLFFHYAHDLGLNFVFRAGGSVVLLPERVTPKKIFELIDKYKPTILMNVPTMMRAMIQDPDRDRYDLSCLRATVSSGEALSAQLNHEWVKTFGVDVVEVLGSAESFLGYLSNRPGEKVPGSVGKPTPFVEVKIVDDKGSEVPKGEPGMLWVKSDAVGTHYHLDHEKSKRTFIGDDWLNTGDMFREDDDGNFWYEGRSEETIKVSGVWVPLLEIQERLLEHPAVKECVLIGVPDSYGLLTAKAYAVLHKGYEPVEEMIPVFQQFCKDKLAAHKYPRLIEFMDDLPKTGQGKIDKRKLRDMEVQRNS